MKEIKFYINEIHEDIIRITAVENDIRFVHFVITDHEKNIKVKYIWFKKANINDITDFDSRYRQIYINNKKLQKYIKPIIKSIFEGTE